MNRLRTITLLLAGFGTVALSGCGMLHERHPTTESRYMSPPEQEYWADRQSRRDKSREWSDELRRQSGIRMSRSMDPINW